MFFVCVGCSKSDFFLSLNFWAHLGWYPFGPSFPFPFFVFFLACHFFIFYIFCSFLHFFDFLMFFHFLFFIFPKKKFLLFFFLVFL